MRRITRRLPQPVLDLIQWADAANAVPLSADRVPGAEGDELRRLAALGALARELATPVIKEWPEPLASWAWDADVTVDASVAAAVREALRSNDVDVLALTYEHVVSGVNRRRLGTFFTPAPIVRYMIQQCKYLFHESPKHVVDPGAGVGAFTLAALAAWPAATVTAVDVNIVTLGLLAARAPVDAAVQRRLVLAPTDYLVWLQEQWCTLQGPRLILGNPPYTRHQCMTGKEKVAAKEVAGDLITSGLAGLSAYFLAATLKALKPSDAACFLLPSSWCETRYGRELREWLWKATKRRIEVQFFPSEIAVFPGTQVAAMILIIGPEQGEDQIFLSYSLGLQNDEVKPLGRQIIQSDRYKACPSTFTELLRTRKRMPIRASVRLGDVVRIRRGVATGGSSFFFINDITREEFGLPSNVLRSALVKPAHCTGIRFDVREHVRLGSIGLPRWLLDLNNSDAAILEGATAKYLVRGRELGVDKRHLTSHRPEWYLVEPVKPPDLFLVPVGKPFHRVIINDARAVGSNNFHGLYLSKDAPWPKERLAYWLMSGEGLRRLADLGRHYHGGSLKIEPGALRTLEIPEKLATLHDIEDWPHETSAT